MATERRPAWLRHGQPKRDQTQHSVYVPMVLLERWRRVEAEGGQVINASALFQEALGRALDALEGDRAARESWLPSRGGSA